MKVVYSPHAKKRMKLRGVKAAEIEQIVALPEVTVRQANGRIKAVGKSTSGNPLSVIYKETKYQIIIVTTY